MLSHEGYHGKLCMLVTTIQTIIREAARVAGIWETVPTLEEIPTSTMMVFWETVGYQFGHV